MSTPVGHSRRQALQETQRSRVRFISGLVKASLPSWPEIASRRELARPRVRCCSSRVARKEGHMAPPTSFRQVPLLLHISTAEPKPPQSDQSRAVFIGADTA